MSATSSFVHVAVMRLNAVSSIHKVLDSQNSRLLLDYIYIYIFHALHR